MVSNKTKERGYLFPLYRYEDNRIFKNPDEPPVYEQIPNFTADFTAYFTAHYGLEALVPEQVMGYVYALLHAPTYRTRYADFLKIDFPRIPFVADYEQFLLLSGLGHELMQAHLLRKDYPGKVDYKGDPDKSTIAKPTHEVVDGEGRLYLNPTNYFAPVPVEVWQFQIGGYQVLDKYLKDRKGTEASLEIIRHVKKIVQTLGFTLAQMQKIDEVWVN